MGWTIWDFLLMNAPQFHHKINEKDLLKGLQEYAGELYCVPRGLAQQLKVILKKEKMVKNILERPKHAAFLDKVRNWVSKIAIRDACSTADIFGGCSGGLLVLLTVVLEWSLRTRTQVLELGPRDWIILFSLLSWSVPVCPCLSLSVI